MLTWKWIKIVDKILFNHHSSNFCNIKNSLLSIIIIIIIWRLINYNKHKKDTKIVFVLIKPNRKIWNDQVSNFKERNKKYGLYIYKRDFFLVLELQNYKTWLIEYEKKSAVCVRLFYSLSWIYSWEKKITLSIYIFEIRSKSVISMKSIPNLTFFQQKNLYLYKTQHTQRTLEWKYRLPQSFGNEKNHVF